MDVPYVFQCHHLFIVNCCNFIEHIHGVLFSLFDEIPRYFFEVANTKDKPDDRWRYYENSRSDSPISQQKARQANEKVTNCIKDLCCDRVAFSYFRVIVLSQIVEAHLHSAVNAAIDQKQPSPSDPNIDGTYRHNRPKSNYSVEEDHQRPPSERVYHEGSNEDTHNEAEVNESVYDAHDFSALTLIVVVLNRNGVGIKSSIKKLTLCCCRKRADIFGAGT